MSKADATTRLNDARQQIIVTRQYTLRLLDGLKPEDWFRQPAEGVTHIGWQVGHLAMAEYWLTMGRLRGTRPEDETIISSAQLALFGKGSAPQTDANLYPTPTELLELLARVHKQALAELVDYTDADLEATVLKPHPLFNTKLDSLYWCGRHEMLHAGQIGLLRRLFGYEPKW